MAATTPSVRSRGCLRTRLLAAISLPRPSVPPLTLGARNQSGRCLSEGVLVWPSGSCSARAACAPSFERDLRQPVACAQPAGRAPRNGHGVEGDDGEAVVACRLLRDLAAGLGADESACGELASSRLPLVYHRLASQVGRRSPARPPLLRPLVRPCQRQREWIVVVVVRSPSLRCRRRRDRRETNRGR